MGDWLTSEPVRTLWIKDNSHVPAGNRTPTFQPVARCYTELSRLAPFNHLPGDLLFSLRFFMVHFNPSRKMANRQQRDLISLLRKIRAGDIQTVRKSHKSHNPKITGDTDGQTQNDTQTQTDIQPDSKVIP
jgi:hypothetical protein